MSKRPHMLHLTVQNPALHTRIFYKLALSQLAAGWKVSVAGQCDAQHSFEESGVTIYPIQPFSRLSPKRLTLRGRLYELVRTLRPDAVTIHAPELLPLAVRMHQKLGTRIWYDVHEDYQLDLHHAAHFPKWLRRPLGDAVRRMEQQALPSISVVTYAEESYADVLQAGDKSSILPNLFTARSQTSPSTVEVAEDPYFLFTGTLARERGTFAAIDCWEQLFPTCGYPLIIAGQSARESIIAELQARIAASPYVGSIRLIGGSEYVPYSDIVALIQGCYAGLGLYEPLPHLVGKLPTKYFEHLALGRPLLYPAHGAWERFGKETGLGVGITATMTGQDILTRLAAWTPASQPERFVWQDEIIGTLLGKLRK